MARKKISIEGNPLESITIGKVKKNRFGWIGIIFIFAIFLSVVYFLPDPVNQNLINNTNIPVGNNPTENQTGENNNQEENEETLIVKYTFNQTKEITVDDLKLVNITNNNNMLSFSITNSTSAVINTEDLFFEGFDENNNLMQRIWLNESIVPNQTKIYNYSLTSNISYFSIRNIPKEDYTYFLLDADSSGKASLTCDNEHQTIIYTFVQDQLKNIEDTVTYSSSHQDFYTMYDYYYSFVSKYGSSTGINANMTSSSINFVYKMNIDYSLFTQKIDNKTYFTKNEVPRVVKFKMEAMNYTCK